MRNALLILATGLFAVYMGCVGAAIEGTQVGFFEQVVNDLSWESTESTVTETPQSHDGVHKSHNPSPPAAPNRRTLEVVTRFKGIRRRLIGGSHSRLIGVSIFDDGLIVWPKTLPKRKRLKVNQEQVDELIQEFQAAFDAYDEAARNEVEKVRAGFRGWKTSTRLSLAVVIGLVASVSCFALLAMATKVAFTGGLAMASVGPVLFEAKDLAKAQRRQKRLQAKAAKLQRKVELAANYHLFPTLQVLGEAHGSQPGHNLTGINPVKKAKAPKITLEASGRWNAAVVMMILEINRRRVAQGLDPWDVGPTDIIFTEFRNGVSPVEVVKAMRALGYVPAGPGIFLKLQEQGSEYNEFLLKVCRTAKDIRSYGRSYTTSPVLDFINPEIPVHLVDMDAMGLGSDGPSYVTQGLEGLTSLAFQARFISSPKDLWTWAKMTFGLFKGLFIQAKIVKNVTTGEAIWVEEDVIDGQESLWDKLKKTNIFDATCPVVDVDGVKYQAGFFIDTSNMAKADLKKPVKACANGTQVTTINGSNFVSFVIAEQFKGRTSLGWQTIQLLHTTILEKHREKLQGKISSKLEAYMEDDFDPEFVSHLEASRFKGKLRAIGRNALNAINLLGNLSGKQMSRVVFGAGLTTQSDYILEVNDLPAGWAIHNPPREADHNSWSSHCAWSADSRYPQQGFESLIAMKNISAVQVARLYAHHVLELDETKADDAAKLGRTGPIENVDSVCMHSLNQFWIDLVSKTGSVQRAKLVLTGLKAVLPFVKAGCKIVSHDDQFGRLRGDADGDKNFWSYDPTIVAVVKETERLAKKLRLPRLEIKGSGVKIDATFDDASWLEVCKKALNKDARKASLRKYFRSANLLCAANNGQGPVGLIANLSTIPLSRLNWEIKIVDGEPRIVWLSEESEKWFAYLLLMQQTGIDMQKRIYPAPSLLKWAAARLFATDSDTDEALTPPPADDAHYAQLGREEIIWTMSTKTSMGINAFESGLMYNERALSHWAGWVLNSIKFGYDFLNSNVHILIDGKMQSVPAMQAGSIILERDGADAFYQWVGNLTGHDIDIISDEWVMVDDLISWKKGANLEEVVGTPAPGIRMIWDWAIESFAKLKSEKGLNHTDPLKELASYWTQEIQNEATEGVSWSYTYRYKGVETTDEYTLKIHPLAWKALFAIFADVTDKNRKDIAESEYMQGDIPNSPAAMKRMLREIFSHDRVASEGLHRYFLFLRKGKTMPMPLVLNNLFSNDKWPAERRQVIALGLARAVFASIVCLAKSGASAKEDKVLKLIESAQNQQLLRGNSGFVMTKPDGVEQDQWQELLVANEGLIGRLGPIWMSEENKTFRTAVRRWGFPTITSAGVLGLRVDGAGFPDGGPYHTAAKKFVQLVADSYVDSRSLKTAEWLADSVWPVIGLIWDLSRETQQRASTLNEGAALADGTKIQLHHLHTLKDGQTQEVIGEKITVKGLLTEAITERFKGVANAAERTRLLNLVQSFDGDIALVDDDNLQLAIRDIMSSRFDRNILAMLRPLTGALRAARWHDQWYSWGVAQGAVRDDDAHRRAWVANAVHKSVYDQTYQRNSDGEIIRTENPDGSESPVVASKWFRTATLFHVPAAFSADLFHQILASPLSASGMYLLCQEARVGGKFSVGRWVYLDSMTYRLAAKRIPKSSGKGYLKAAKGEILMKLWLMAHMDRHSEISLGMAYHNHHRSKALATCRQMATDGRQFRFDLCKISVTGDYLERAIDAVNTYLVSHIFEYAKKGQTDFNLVEVKVPYLWGANNKLATPTDQRNWFMSSKMWTVLATLGLVDFSNDFDAAKHQWSQVWGFEYPTKGRDQGQSALPGSGSSTVKVKEMLPWLRKDFSIETRRACYYMSVGLVTDNAQKTIPLSGLPTPRKVIEKALELRFSNQHTKPQIKAKNLTTHKAILGCLGLSSVEYQWELLTRANLDNPAKADYVTPVSRGWASCSVSALRDLFGGLGDYQGWSVGQTYYVRPMRPKAWTEDVVKDILNEIFVDEITSEELAALVKHPNCNLVWNTPQTSVSDLPEED